jgi:hypothetical protein
MDQKTLVCRRLLSTAIDARPGSGEQPACGSGGHRIRIRLITDAPADESYAN